MDDSLDDTSDLFSDPDFWGNQSFSLNTTAANTSSVLKAAVSPLMNTAINALVLVIVFITMVSLGCTIELSKMKSHIVKPKGVAIAVLAQYGVMPLIAFCLVKAFQQTGITAVAILICGCCPGGVLSNIMALAVQGDMDLSILMTSCSTLLAFGMMPLLLSLYCRGSNLENVIPYVDITISLVMILVPCGIGIFINHYRPQYTKTITRVGFTFMVIAVLGVSIAAVVTVGGSFMTVLSPPLIASSALMPFTGYAFGYIISWVFGLNPAERRTVSLETGCQNTQVCATILKLAFPPEVVGPLFLFPFVYGFFQVVEAGLLVVLFRCHQRFTLKEKEKYQPAITEEHQKEASEGTV